MAQDTNSKTGTAVGAVWQWEEMSLLGKWSKVTAADPPMVKNGRIKTAEGQGARVRNVRLLEQTEETTE